MKEDWSQKLPMKNLFSKSVFLLMVKLLTIYLNDKDPNTQVKALIRDQTEKINTVYPEISLGIFKSSFKK